MSCSPPRRGEGATPRGDAAWRTWSTWITDNKIPVGDWMAALVEFIKDNTLSFFDILAASIGFVVDGFTSVLEWVPEPLLIVALTVGTYALRRSWGLAAFVAFSLLFVLNQGYWNATMETLSLVLFSALLSTAIGVPLGIAAAHRPWLFQALRPVLDLMQTLPTFVYLLPTLVLFGLGTVPGLISTVIFALPAPVRLTHLGITSVPRPLIEAGEAFGATRRQLLWKVELPSARPTIFAGITQCIMLVAQHGGDRRPGRRRRAGRAGGARAQPGEGRHGVRGGVRDRAGGDRARPHLPPAGAEPSAVSDAVAFRDVDIVFGSGSGTRRRRQREEALRLLDAGQTRSEIAAKTGAVVGVADATLSVPEGRICVLMGLSGSGKSTLLRAANGLNPATRGQVLVRDGAAVVDVASCDARTLRRVRMERVAMVFQQFALLPWRTRARECRLRPGDARRARRPSGGASWTRSWRWSGSTSGATAMPRNSPAACSSASASPAPSPPTPTSC